MLFTKQKSRAVVAPNVAVQVTSQGQGKGSDCLVAVAGPITVDSSPDLRKQLLQCLWESECEGIVVDFSDVAYVDTSALAVLLEVFKAALMLNKNFQLRGLRDRPRYLFETTRLLRLFEKTGRNAPESEVSS